MEKANRSQAYGRYFLNRDGDPNTVNLFSAFFNTLQEFEG